MDDDAIAALFASAQEVRAGTAGAPGGLAPNAPTVHPVDFRRPRQFTGEIERRLRRSVDTLCRTASNRLSSELRTAVDLEVIGSEQLIWSDAHGALAPSSVTAVLTTDPIGTRMVLAAELGLLLSSIERMLGGLAEQQPPPRRLTDIDLALAGEVFDLITEQLSILWEELMEVTVAVDGVVALQQIAQLAPTSEPTLVFTLEVTLFDTSNTLALMIPYRSITGVIERLTVTEGRDPADEAAAAAAMRGGIGTVEVAVRAEIGAVDLPATDVLGLRAGDTISFRAPASAGVTLHVDDTVVGSGMPGRQGAYRAVQTR